MKVIVAGLGKTGTKSMHVALMKLGYSVYDYPENVYGLREEYKKIFSEGWTTEDFRRMYEDVDSIVDAPACYFWEEIHKAFPEAKIVLTIRESEDIWYKSMEKFTRVAERNFMLRAIEFLSPTQRRAMRDVVNQMGPVIYGMQPASLWSIKFTLNEAMLKLKYRAHNAYVMKNAPADKLLVYNCSDGWKPLCDFLGVPIPDKPFPRKNVRGNIIEEILQTNPIFIRMQREVLISSAILVAALAAGSYAMYSVGPVGIIKSVSSRFSDLWHKIGF